MPAMGTVATAPFSPGVLDFAVRNKVDLLLEPLLAATRQVFPTARDLRVLLESDPEIRDDWHIVFDVGAPESDIPDYLEVQHRWVDELFRICPATSVCILRLALSPVTT